MEKLDFKYQKKLEKEFKRINEYNLFKDARDIYYSLNKSLSDNTEQIEPELIKEFKKLKARHGFIAISKLPEKDIFHLYNYYIRVALDIPYYNLWENLKKYLIIYTSPIERDKIKDSIKKILEKSDSSLTNTSLIFVNEKARGTLENWLKDYFGYIGSTKSVNTLKFEQYFIDSQNIKKLSKEEKEKIKEFFKFYEKLKLSSTTPEGFEEEIPMVINNKLKIWKDGKLEDIDIAAHKAVEEMESLGFFKDDMNKNNLDELKEMANKYPVGSLEGKAIKEEIDRLNH